MSIITIVFDFDRQITFVNTLGTRLRHARKLRQLTQKELARACGLSQGAIGNYETDSRRNPQDIFRIAEALKIEPAWLATGSGSMELQSAYRLEDMPISQGIWPFREIDPARIWALSENQRSMLEKALLGMIVALEEKEPAQSLKD